MCECLVADAIGGECTAAAAVNTASYPSGHISGEPAALADDDAACVDAACR